MWRLCCHTSHFPVMFANKIECIGWVAGLHRGQNFDRNRKIFLVPGEIFIDISHHILAVANLISKIFNLAISYSGIKILIDNRNVLCNFSKTPLSVWNVHWQKPSSLALMLTIIQCNHRKFSGHISQYLAVRILNILGYLRFSNLTFTSIYIIHDKLLSNKLIGILSVYEFL